MTGTDIIIHNKKVWFAENCPNLIIVGEVPNGAKDLPSTLISRMLCLGEILSILIYFLLTTEQEAPKSNNNCV